MSAQNPCGFRHQRSAQAIGWKTANNEKKKAKTALDGLRAEISKGFQNAANAERNGWNILKKAGIGATQTYTKGSLGAIEQAIQLKQEALKHLTNNDDYKKGYGGN